MDLGIPRDRRISYRVSPDDDQLAVALKTPSGETRADEVLDISIGGTKTRFPRRHTPALGVGNAATLLIESPQLRRRLSLDAVLVASLETGLHREFCFRFASKVPLGPGENAELYNLFNRRAAFRGAEPDPRNPVEVTLHPLTKGSSQATFTASLRNISACGLSILAASDVDMALAGISHLEVSFRLPFRERMFRMNTSIRYRAGHGDCVCYGLQLDPLRTMDFVSQAEEIVEYMIDRYDDELRSVVH